MIQFDEHIFQMGWNHQPDDILNFQQLFVSPAFSSLGSNRR